MSEDAKHQAFAPQPGIAPLTDILLDAWALTSIREALPVSRRSRHISTDSSPLTHRKRMSHGAPR